MRTRTGEELKSFLQDKSFHSYQERDAMHVLDDYLNSPNDNKVMILNGLRRTGKTTMMYQAICSHVDINDSMLIRCSAKDDVDDIADRILAADEKYVFLDEVTKVPNFIDFASSLSDEAAFSGHKIVMAGTDSLGFAFAKNDELFDRAHEIHTTYIPYSEFYRLTGKNLFEYMKYGGTLSDEDYFYNEDNLEEYTNSAIASNILHTLRYWKNGEFKNDLYPAVTRADIYSLVNYYLRDESKRFLAESLEEFKASEFHSPAQMYESKIRKAKRHPELVDSEEHIPDPSPLRDEQLSREWQEMLQIKDDYPFEVDDKLITKLREYLTKLDVLTYVKDTDQYYFTQPGMRYCHVDAAIDTLCENSRIKKEYSQDDIDVVSTKIREDIEGRLIEDIALLDIRNSYKSNDKVTVYKYRYGNSEYDLALLNRQTEEAVVFEVKRSAERVPFQKKHLQNIELREEFERVTGCKIIGSAVLYSGNTCKDEDGFLYINSSEVLQDVSFAMKKHFPDFDGSGPDGDGKTRVSLKKSANQKERSMVDDPEINDIVKQDEMNKQTLYNPDNGFSGD